MASNIQFVTAIQLNDYLTIVILTAIGYDYILTFSKEVEYVWTKPWSRVSTLFVLVRYIGLCFIVADSILGSSFLPGPIEVYVSVPHHYVLMTTFAIERHNRCNGLVFLQTWTSFIFIVASDLVAVLRVWALYHRSRRILATLLLLFSIESILYLISCAVTSWNFVPLDIVRVSGFSFCTRSGSSTILPNVVDSFQLAVGTSMYALVGVQLIHQSVQMYRATKQYKLDHYFNALVMEGIMYFIAVLMYWVITILVAAADIPMYEPWTILLGTAQVVPLLTFTPRFILNLRELYANDLKPQLGSDLDTGFGLISQFGRSTLASAEATHPVAQENEGAEELEQDGEIQTEERGVRSAGGDV